MSRQSRNSKRALFNHNSETPSPKVGRTATTSDTSISRPSSPNDSLISTIHSHTSCMLDTSHNEFKILFDFIIDLTLSYDKIYLQKMSQSEIDDVINKIRLDMSSEAFSTVQLFIQHFIHLLSQNITNTNTMVYFILILL